MKILAFDGSLRHRQIVGYSPHYRTVFLTLKIHVEEHYPDLELTHVGSTAITGLSGKPMIDCIAATKIKNLRKIQDRLVKIGFQKREVWTDTNTKPYVCGAVSHDDKLFNINIHVCNCNDDNYKSMIQFRDLMRAGPEFHDQYVQAKLKAHERYPGDPEKYNQEKEKVILNILKNPPLMRARTV